jgi:FKBP-type peptidyl-prolyl cis-trans isomerase
MSRFSDFSKRFGSILLASMFLITSVAFTAIIIWESAQQDKDQTTQNSIQQALQEQTNQEGENMLKGTPLANFTPVTTTVGELQIIDLVQGTGEVVPEGATITAHYTGAYAVNGEVFESSKDNGQPATFPLSGVIEGWTKGVPGMKVGGTRRLVIPGPQAYGEAPEGYVPGSTSRPLGPLVFDIELVSLQ